MGLVPTQAGIFSTQTIIRNATSQFDQSTAFMPARNQASNMTLRFAQSTYAIAAQNETLTQYMARNFTLAPIRPKTISPNASISHGNWSAPTTMYSVDLYCEPAVFSRNSARNGLVANSTNGCSFHLGLNGNITMGGNKAWPGRTVLNNKEFTAMYVGYWNPLGFADYSLDNYCPTTSNTTFYAAISRNKARGTDAPQNVTAIYCWPTYYQQSVLATVDAVSLEPSLIRPTGAKKPLESSLFNTTRLEQLMSSNSLGDEVRGDLIPSKSVPDYIDSIARTGLSLGSGPMGAGVVQPMVGLALAVSNLPLEDYLDWKVLAKSYADGYRLMFARAMRDVLDQDFRTSNNVTGHIIDTTEAVLMEPVFVYVVEGFLGAISLATIALLYLSLTRSKNLRSNPSTIAAIMAMVADNEPLLADIEGLDCCTTKGIEEYLGHKRYKLVDDGTSVGSFTRYKKLFRHFQHLQLLTGKTGLPLPSKNTLVQNILENYIPTAVATLIEPIWVLFNRMLCMLQPIEELQSCNARAKKSIDLDYASLPPQLVIFKALRSKHIVLAAVCTMALLANLLAVSLAGLFNQATIDIQHAIMADQPLQFKFMPVDGNIGPVGGQNFGSNVASGAYQGSNGEEQFLIADSYLRQGIPLPAWTDENMFYLPFAAQQTNTTATNDIEARTRAFGAKLECNSLRFDKTFQAGIIRPLSTSEAINPSVNITVTTDTGRSVQCTKTGTYMRQAMQ
ncbi:hypothetical protein J4E80_001937 [Alternaria sp. BMP 0032]|nr:hypothetical protein J4E80_001937 [Alternaria sp. BMP 0032]